MQYLVRVSPQLLESMTLAAIEAYCYGDGAGGSDDNPLTHVAKETLGHIWGFRKIERDRTIFFLDRMSLNISATRGADSVFDLNNRAARLKNDVVKFLSPELSLLGDFHTHPHPNMSETVVRREGLYQFSPEDFKSFIADDLIWESSNNNPVMLVITICERRRANTDVLGYPHWNIATYPIGQFRFWISAVVGFLAGGRGSTRNRRKHTLNKAAKVQINIDNHIQSLDGDRVEIDQR
jgi:hypothetical protein